MRGKKAKEGDFWFESFELREAGMIRLPENEEFVSYMPIDDRLFVLSNKSIYEIVEIEGVFGCVVRKLKNCVRKLGRIGRTCS